MAAIIARAIERGLIRRHLNTPQFKPTPEELRIRHRNYVAAKRKAFVRSGLNTNGQPRQRPHKWLDALTPDQKRRRRLKQQRRAMDRARHKRVVKM